jgi:hypothetical protein
MWRAIRYASLAGLLLPLVLLALFSLENTLETYFWWLGSLAKWLWPSWFLLGATAGEQDPLVGWTIVVIAVAINAVLYSILGALAFLVVTRFIK